MALLDDVLKSVGNVLEKVASDDTVKNLGLGSAAAIAAAKAAKELRDAKKKS